MKKGNKLWIAELLIIAALLVIGAYFVRYAYIKRTYMEIEGEQYLRGSVVDYTDRSITGEEYDRLLAEYPGVEFKWLVPVCGLRLDPATEELTVPAGADYDQFTAEIKWLTALKRVDLGEAGFTNAQNAAFLRDYPGITVTHYYVTMDGVQYDPATTDFNLEYRPELPAILEETAPYFVNGIRVVDFGTAVLEPAEADALRNALGAEVYCCYSFFGKEIPWNADTLDLSNTAMTDTAAVEAVIAAMPTIKHIDMDYTGLSNETLDALNQKYPDVDIVWTIKVWGDWQTFELRTDREHFCLSQFSWASYPGFTDEGLYALRYCRNMITLDLGHTDITNIDMCANMPHLKYLIFVDTGVTSIEPLRNCYELYYIEAFFNRISDFSPLADKTSLRHLNICYTRCSDVKLLCSMTWLERLWIKETFMSGSGCRTVQKTLTNTLVVWNTDIYGDNAVADGYWRNDPSYFEMRDNLGLAYMS